MNAFWEKGKRKYSDDEIEQEIIEDDIDLEDLEKEEVYGDPESL